WPGDVASFVAPYTVKDRDALAEIAKHFEGADARSLAQANAAMPGTVAEDVTITIDQHQATTSAPSSFDEVCGLFSPVASLDALAGAIAARTDVLARGALLVCPRGVLVADAGVDGITPGHAAGPYGVAPVALLAANAGTPDLLLAGQSLAAWATTPGEPGDPAPVETTAAHDTLTAVVERFRRAGVATSIETIVAANAGLAFLRAGAAVLVPPATAQLTGRVGAVTPGGIVWTFPAAVFPLRVTLELARDEALVDPTLAETAARDRTAVPAARPAGDSQDAARTLAAFATDLQGAVPVLRVATGQVLSDGVTGQVLGGDTDVWAVDFGSTGIAEATVTPPLTIDGTPQPRTFALRPLASTLIARQDVFTRSFDASTGRLTGGEKRNYQGIDLEVWARTLLADLELVLSAAYTQGAYALNRPALDGIVEAKKTLAGAVAEGLDYVLVGEAPPPPDPKRAAAVETLRQQLLVSLTRGYDTAAVIQYDTSARSPWPATYARLSGNPKVTFNDPDASTATVSNGKVSLTDGSSQVSFLVNVPDVQAHAGLDLTLDFNVVELEFAIEPEIEGYERSDWLSFVTSIGDGSPPALRFELGSPQVPLPLRAYPPMPLLVGHEAIVPTDPVDLADAVTWRYEFELQHQSAEQDAVEFRVTYNSGGSGAAGVAGDDDLFAALAQYTAVSTPLLGLLAGILDRQSAPSGQKAALAAALDTYETLVTTAGTAWQAHWGPPPQAPEAEAPDVGAPVLDEYDYALGLKAGDGWYTTLRLTMTEVSGPGGVGWPDIWCITTAGDEYELFPVGPADCDCTDPDHCHCYAFPEGKVAAFTLLTFRFTFPKVHVASYQNASSRTWVTRNARLLGDAWPDTTPGFVYRTPEVSYPKAVVPFIDVTGSIPIDPWAGAPLQAMFDTIFDNDPADRTIAVGVRYGYTLVEGPPLVEALLPVVQSTVGPYGGATIGVLTEWLDQWLRDTDPARDGGAWAFWVSLYSSLDPTLQRPVLQLKRVSSALVGEPPAT
ncbi:MAG TPA: hypothetical protein VH479_07850, partial [Acidimicrobiales bacterium]